MQELVGKREESVTNLGVADGVINNLGYSEKQTNEWGDAFVLGVCGIMGESTNTYVSVDMPVSGGVRKKTDQYHEWNHFVH